MRGLTRVFALLSCLAVFNLIAAPLAAAAAPPAATVEQIAAELKTTFGDAFQLCVNDDGSTPLAPSHHGFGDCPLCCASAAALAPPASISLPARREAETSVRFSATEFAPPPPSRASPAQPRAPPFGS